MTSPTKEQIDESNERIRGKMLDVENWVKNVKDRSLHLLDISQISEILEINHDNHEECDICKFRIKKAHAEGLEEGKKIGQEGILDKIQDYFKKNDWMSGIEYIRKLRNRKEKSQ